MTPEKKHKAVSQISVITVALVLTVSMAYAATWVGPTANPPLENTDAPLNVSTDGQSKAGGLSINQNGSSSSVGLLLQGRMGIGVILPAKALDVAGQIHASQDICTDEGGGVCLSSASGDVSWDDITNKPAGFADDIDDQGVPGESIPSGLIAIFTSSCPSGWTRFTALDDRYPRGSASYGGTGGTANHSHSGNTSTAGNHSHPIPYFSWGGNNNVTGAPGAYATSHGSYIERTEKNTSSNGNHSHPFSTNSVSNLDPYANVVFCQKN